MTSIAPPARPALESKLRTTLVEAVNASGYTHRQIAERAGLSVSTVAKALCGERAGQIDTWDLILTAADVELVAVLR
jgi:transcriptional regulator with XRE-family HTH domain